MIAQRLATLAELESVLGLEDVYDLLEVMGVDAYNRRVIAKAEEDKP